MKRVSFKVAKVIKEAGYPQRFISSFGWYNKEGKSFDSSYDLPLSEKDDEYIAPTYFEVWFWLWCEKKITVELTVLTNNKVCPLSKDVPYEEYNDPEEAIIAAVEYLANNNLIK